MLRNELSVNNGAVWHVLHCVPPCPTVWNAFHPAIWFAVIAVVSPAMNRSHGD